MALQSCRSSLARRHGCVRMLSQQYARTFATETPLTPDSFKMRVEQLDEQGRAPRWKETPAAMKAAMPMDHAKKAYNKVWVVNNSPERLDAMYNQLLGPGGSKLLPEEVKWLAVTHKSFDQGRRGFNDRLALLGRYTLVMEGTKHIISKPPMKGTKVVDEFDRTPFEHEQLASIDNLNVQPHQSYLRKDKLYDLGVNVGLLEVLRWKPRQVNRLDTSGVEVVMNGAIYAIVGALVLHHGSVVAAQIVREKILSRLPDN
ncbi:hypothetical protein S7711_09181 [Stachybotrys chartarum IBT 7711]|uniref:RNase III domain-containing protein n=1 Tax=Stachybotrys chartarum (strain CBS 109288 / IBT 7711) TaxID=1280523 RepID=A0A084ALS4_STACB|nr:hypothetical protein S7711_09181 [Stachybotrys chartarum IBT 7711]